MLVSTKYFPVYIKRHLCILCLSVTAEFHTEPALYLHGLSAVSPLTGVHLHPVLLHEHMTCLMARHAEIRPRATPFKPPGYPSNITDYPLEYSPMSHCTRSSASLAAPTTPESQYLSRPDLYGSPAFPLDFDFDNLLANLPSIPEFTNFVDHSASHHHHNANHNNVESKKEVSFPLNRPSPPKPPT